MPITARSCGVQPAGLVRGAGGWDPPQPITCCVPPRPCGSLGQSLLKANGSGRADPPGERDPRDPQAQRAPSLRPGSLCTPGAAAKPSAGSQLRPETPPRRCINTGSIETFCSKYLFLGKTPELLCFVSIVQKGLALYLLRHRGGGRTGEIQGMLLGGDFRGSALPFGAAPGAEQHRPGRKRSTGRCPHPATLLQSCPGSPKITFDLSNLKGLYPPVFLSRPAASTGPAVAHGGV